jgi:formamidopyrimidine-DNA glycosylase
MPELPEVEAVARTLRPLVERRRIRCVHVFHPIAVKPQSPSHVARVASKRRIQSVTRRGKYLFLDLDCGTVTMHFKLGGQLIWFPNAKDLLKHANQSPDQSGKRPATNVHVDVAFGLDNGILAFADRRPVGRVYAYDATPQSLTRKSLGVEALSPEFTPAHLGAILGASSTSPASRASATSTPPNLSAINPLRPADSLSAKEARRLHKAIVSVLNRALECCLHSAPDFRDPKRWFQGIEDILQVYDREGESCRRWGADIKRIAQGGHSTYYCARCHKWAPLEKPDSVNPTPLKKPADPAAAAAAKKPDFEKSLARLEEVVRRLESPQLSLDDAMKLFEEGVSLSRECQKQLEDAEGRVEILLKKADGKLAAEPFDPEQESES